MNAEDRRRWDEQAEVLRDIRQHQEQMRTDLDKLTTTVTGNGGQGHEQRIKANEDWRLSHPQECPMKPETRRARSAQWIALGVFGIGLVTLGLKLLGVY